MQTNTPARPSGATVSPYHRMDAHQLLEAAKTLVAAEQLAALSFTAAQRVEAEDQSALVDWAEGRMEALSDDLFDLLQEFGSRKDLDADGVEWLNIAIAISNDIVRRSYWQVEVRRVA